MHFDQIHGHFDQFDPEFDRIDQINEQFDQIDEQFDQIDENLIKFARINSNNLMTNYIILMIIFDQINSIKLMVISINFMLN